MQVVAVAVGIAASISEVVEATLGLVACMADRSGRVVRGTVGAWVGSEECSVCLPSVMDRSAEGEGDG
jgi:hypothetical protein